MEENIAILPIIGFKTNLADNVLSDYAKSLLEEDSINLDNFKVKFMPTLRFLGSNRRIAIIPENLSYSVDVDSENQDYVVIQFTLKRGSYATVVLRELMKAVPLKY